MQERERAFAGIIKGILNGVTISDTSRIKAIAGIPKEYLDNANNTIIRIQQNEGNFTNILNDTLLLCAQLGCLEKYTNAKAGSKNITALLNELCTAIKAKLTESEEQLSKAETGLKEEKSSHEKTKSGSKSRKDRLDTAKEQKTGQMVELIEKNAVILGHENIIKLKEAKIEQLGEELRRVTRDMDASRLLLRNYEETIANNLKFRNVLKYFEEQLLVDPRDKIDCKFELMTEDEMLHVMSGLKQHLAIHPHQFNAANLLREARAKYTLPTMTFFTPQLPGPVARPTPYITMVEDGEPSKSEHAPLSERKLVSVTNRRSRGMAFPEDSTNDNPPQARKVSAARQTLSPRSNGK